MASRPAPDECLRVALIGDRDPVEFGVVVREDQNHLEDVAVPVDVVDAVLAAYSQRLDLIGNRRDPVAGHDIVDEENAVRAVAKRIDHI